MGDSEYVLGDAIGEFDRDDSGNVTGGGRRSGSTVTDVVSEDCCDPTDPVLQSTLHIYADEHTLRAMDPAPMDGTAPNTVVNTFAQVLPSIGR